MSTASQKPVYCIDTSSLIRGWNEAYPIEAFPSFWDRMEGLAHDGRLIAPDEVLRETERRDDGLHKWLKARSEIFRPIDQELQVAVARVMSDFQLLVKNRPGKNAADPWIIALAEIERGHGTVVVTEENEDNSSSNPKIPLVCRHYGIEFIRLLDLIRIERWQF